MNRRSGPTIVRILLTAMVVLTVVGALCVTPAAQVSAGTDTTVDPDITVTTDITIDTANPFLPENRDLSDCVGMLQRPGCGSESRGGWHQNLVAIAMIGGLLIVFGRVAWGVRRSQKQHPRT